MKKQLKYFLAVIPFLVFISCEHQESKSSSITVSGNTMTVTGESWVEGGNTLSIPAGMTVKFQADDKGYSGTIILTAGSKFIAQGTAEQTISFESGRLSFLDGAGIDNELKYCSFTDTIIYLENSLVIKYCKFADSTVNITGDSQALIIYNTFDENLTFLSSAITIGTVVSLNNSAPRVYYNSIIGRGKIGINALSGAPLIENNNITDAKEEAIYSLINDLVVTSNYISDCNGSIGTDITGSQSYNVSYSSPLFTSVAEAGCGW
jgi:hypothetical protein